MNELLGVSNELLWLVMLLANFLMIIVLYRTMGKLGLLIWIPISCIIANIQVVKLIDLFGFQATLGNIVYATSFLCTDILSENYGKKEANKAVVVGFVSLLAMTGLMNLALVFTPSGDDFSQSSLVQIFSLMPRIALASFAAYFFSQFHDVWAYNFHKKRHPNPRYIWIRNNLSTLVSQAIDSVVFTTIAFWGEFPLSVFLNILITTYVLKAIVAACDTPLVYLARFWHDKGVVAKAPAWFPLKMAAMWRGEDL